ncbi:hypothetical protein ABC977_12080 [Thioalkalicoccus limnaeus]|uniref:Uncharacterized protein n=1 Tax=Thioalkalicoccus limnaeus TaxID=120681 RepID=A0ABV4BG15_9GAMM
MMRYDYRETLQTYAIERFLRDSARYLGVSAASLGPGPIRVSLRRPLNDEAPPLRPPESPPSPG